MRVLQKLTSEVILKDTQEVTRQMLGEVEGGEEQGFIGSKENSRCKFKHEIVFCPIKLKSVLLES